jgi:hypothetical protein
MWRIYSNLDPHGLWTYTQHYNLICLVLGWAYKTKGSLSLHQVNHFQDLESSLHPEFAFDFENIWLNGSEDFWNIFPIQIHVKTVSPIEAPPNPRDHDFNKLAFVLYQKTFM